MSILDTIKQTIADMTINNQPEPVQESATDDIPNEIFVEFAKLVPELDPASDIRSLAETLHAIYNDLEQVRVYVLTDRIAKSKSFKTNSESLRIC